MHNFDEILNRRASESFKWREYPSDVLPLFVADMDFRSPEPVANALRRYIDEGVFGYPRGLHTHDFVELPELAEIDRRAGGLPRVSAVAGRRTALSGIEPRFRSRLHSARNAGNRSNHSRRQLSDLARRPQPEFDKSRRTFSQQCQGCAERR